MTKTIPAAEFWEFKARIAEADLELVKLRLAGEALAARRNALTDAFAKAHGLSPAKPLTLDDATCTATQEDA